MDVKSLNEKIMTAFNNLNYYQSNLIEYYEASLINKIYSWVNGFNKKNEKLKIQNIKAEIGTLINLKEEITNHKGE